FAGASNTVNPLISTSYTAVGTDANGCVATSNVVNISVNPLPLVIVTGDIAICSGSSIQLLAGGADTYVWSPVNGLNNSNIWNPVATPTSTTTYTVTGNIAGCSNSANVTITVNPLPIASISNDTTICGGTSVMLNASGGNYLWSTGEGSSAILVNPTTTTTYSVTVTSSSCEDTANVVVTVNPAPIVTASGDTTVCAGTSVTLSGAGAVTYSWDNAVVDGTPFTPVASTTYTVTGTDVNSCTNTDQVIVTVNSLPIVNIYSVPDSVCASEASIHLMASPFGGNWSGTGVSGNSFNPNIGTQTITYSYTDANTCLSIDTQVINVFNPPVPDSTIITGSNIVFLYLSSQLQYSVKLVIIHANDTIKHYYSAIFQNDSMVAFSAHIIDGDLMLIEPVSSTLEVCVYDRIYIGIGDIKGEDIQVSFYPNPFSDYLTVTIPQGNYEVSIIDMLGRNVRSISVTGNFKIQRDDLVEGLYLLQIILNEKLVFSDKLKVQN
ncbi:MAG: T9SS type A sorting domain-containing protein, partial [Candidatus Paceibacterota bacterium]